MWGGGLFSRLFSLLFGGVNSSFLICVFAEWSLSEVSEMETAGQAPRSRGMSCVLSFENHFPGQLSVWVSMKFPSVAMVCTLWSIVRGMTLASVDLWSIVRDETRPGPLISDPFGPLKPFFLYECLHYHELSLLQWVVSFIYGSVGLFVAGVFLHFFLLLAIQIFNLNARCWMHLFNNFSLAIC